MKKTRRTLVPVLVLAGTVLATSAMATTCKDLPSRDELKTLLVEVVHTKEGNAGLGMPVWLTLVDTSGLVCAVVHSLDDAVDVTVELSMGHRVFSAHKANTSNAFSHSKVAIASANLNSAQNPGGAVAAALLITPVDVFAGSPAKFGTAEDPMVGQRVGGMTGLGGGLPLFNQSKKKVGAIGVSGDSLCTDHVIAWKVREKLAGGTLSGANVPFGVSAKFNDMMVQDIEPNFVDGAPGFSPSSYGHVTCRNNPTPANDGGSIEYHNY
jgi:uncharacterized protein GlcG (DUF336 family)